MEIWRKIFSKKEEQNNKQHLTFKIVKPEDFLRNTENEISEIFENIPEGYKIKEILFPTRPINKKAFESANRKAAHIVVRDKDFPLLQTYLGTKSPISVSFCEDDKIYGKKKSNIVIGQHEEATDDQFKKARAMHLNILTDILTKK